MPENIQEQDISKRYGAQISDNDLPYDNDRRIIVDSTGCCSLSFERKRAEEVLDYYIDLMKWLEPNETIIGASAWASPDTLIPTRVEYASTGVVAWMAGGEDCKRNSVFVEVSTSLGKIKLIQFILETFGSASLLLLVTGEGDEVTVTSNLPPAPEPEAKLAFYPPSIDFPLTAAVSGHTERDIILKNDGTATAHIESIVLDGPFSQINSGDTELLPGEYMQIHLSFNPDQSGAFGGYIEVQSADLEPLRAVLTGTAEDAHRVTVQGNQFVLTGGTPFKIKAINWFGAETEVFAPHGLWSRNYKDLIDQIKAMGFNAVRLPFSGDICNNERMPASNTIDGNLNPDLVSLPTIQVLDKLINYMNDQQIYIILDHHRRHAGDGADGSPIDSEYTLNQWKASWLFMAERYKNLDYLLGADLHNEPYQLEWEMWASLAETAGNSIHSIAPHWLIFVEGVGSYGANSYWWGGELSGVADRPVQLSVPGRLAYSAHEYGISVGEQPWLAKGSAVPAQWPMNLYAVWRQHWGFIVEQNIAPVWIGEVGGKFGVNGTGEIVTDTNAQFERQWMYHLQRYMAGYYEGDLTGHLTGAEQGMSFAYWALNPNSSDTGGILKDDWTAEQTFKLELISMMLSNMSIPDVFGLSPLDYNEVDDNSQIILSQGGENFAITMTDFKDAMRMRIYEVGEVHFFSQDVDVTARYAGQQWARLAAADRMIRISALDGANVGTTGGSDTVTIAKTNLPAVQINVTGTAASTDLGTKTTSTAGAHTHKIGSTYTADNLGAGGTTYMVSGSTVDTTSNGDHNHSIALGSHGHTVSGTTENLGSGTTLDVTNKYITLAAWYRIS